MLNKGSAKKVTIYVNEDTQHHMQPLYQAILTYLMHKGVTGATASRALAGFGPHHVMHTTATEFLSEHLPVRIEFVDTEEKVNALMPTLNGMVTDGLIEVQDTTIVRSAMKEQAVETRGPHQKIEGKGKLLRIFMDESDKWNGLPLYDAIVQKCRELSIAGATVFRGLEGFGESAEIHKHHLIARDQPIVVTIVDSDDNIRRLLPVLEDMIDVGLIAISDVEVIRIRPSESA
jgi:PII-like signaling protein